jgi:hypothetical protein
MSLTDRPLIDGGTTTIIGPEYPVIVTLVPLVLITYSNCDWAVADNANILRPIKLKPESFIEKQGRF